MEKIIIGYLRSSFQDFDKLAEEEKEEFKANMKKYIGYYTEGDGENIQEGVMNGALNHAKARRYFKKLHPDYQEMSIDKLIEKYEEDYLFIEAHIDEIESFCKENENSGKTENEILQEAITKLREAKVQGVDPRAIAKVSMEMTTGRVGDGKGALRDLDRQLDGMGFETK